MDQAVKKFDWPSLNWPINEILLQSLVFVGMKDDEIAKLYQVSPTLVTERREAFGL